MKHVRFGLRPSLVVAAALIFMSRAEIAAHCDTLDGPVVQAAEKALTAGDVNLVLLWVQKEDEDEIEEAFRRTLAVRKLSPEAKALADRYFFETLVRVHRAGEGAPFTGLKPPGTGITPAIAQADEALRSSDVSPLLKEVSEQVSEGIHARFKKAALKKDYKPGDVQAGREYVQAYVEYVHYVENIHRAATQGTEHQDRPGPSFHPKGESDHSNSLNAHAH